MSPLEQAQAAGFSPYLEPVTYTDAQYAAGNMPGTFGYEAPSKPLLAESGGMNFNLGTVDAQGRPTITNQPGLEMWAAAIGMPKPSASAAVDATEYQEALTTWWAGTDTGQVDAQGNPIRTGGIIQQLQPFLTP